MSNPTGANDGTILPTNTDSVGLVDESPVAANSAISAPIDSPQVPIEAPSSGLVSDLPLPPVQSPTSATRPTRGRGSRGGGTRNRRSKSSSGRRPGRPRKVGLIEEKTESQPNPSDVLPSLPAPPNYVSAPLPPLPAKPSSSTMKPKGRVGRPPGSCSKQPASAPASASSALTLQTIANNPLGIPTCDLAIAVICVSQGEDVHEKLMKFVQRVDKSMYISSCYGSVSSATLRRPTASGGSTKYEGQYQITSFSGSLIRVENQGQQTWTGGFMVSLTGPDNHHQVGGVAGSMIASSPVEIVVCTFNFPSEDSCKRRKLTETDTPAANGGAVRESGNGGDVAGTSNSIPDNNGA